MNKTPKILKEAGSEVYIVVTRVRNGLEYGELIDSGTVIKGPESPVGTILSFRGMEDFQPYTGDPEPLLKLLRDAGISVA